MLSSSRLSAARAFRVPIRLVIHAALLAAFLFTATAPAQVPIPMQEQVNRFNELSSSEQQALIRELQDQLPPAQRDAIVEMLRGQQQAQDGEGEGEGQLRPGMLSEQDGLGALLEQTEERMRLGARSTLIVELTEREEQVSELPDAEQQSLTELRERIADGNPYRLDESGRLDLPGIPIIELSGLNIEQATARVQSERRLRNFEVELTNLPLEPVGTEALERFGDDLFEDSPSTFAPATDIPVPADYVIGPGDSVSVQLFGNTNAEYFLDVSREGTINFPQIGPITVAGLSLTELRETISTRVSEQMIGTRASVTLGELRSIRVFVLGDVEEAGSYTVSGLSTMTNALLASGGVTEIGSLRNVQLRRNGETVSTLDLYDLLLEGDTSADRRLEPGDVIFVPPTGPTVSVEGEVRRPAIYEIGDEETLADVIELAGGLTAEASEATIKLERIEAGEGVSVQDLTLAEAGNAETGIRDGDVLRVQPNLDRLEGAVRLVGNVYRPGLYQWYPGMTLADVLPNPELVRPKSDTSYVLIRREPRPNVAVETISADLEGIWQGEPGANNVELQARDTVHVFNLEEGRQHIVQPILEELRAQAPTNQAVPRVSVAGEVRAAGEYPLEPDMRVTDLLRAGGGMTDAAYALEAELTRYEVVDGERRTTEVVDIDLDGALAGDRAADILLEPYDYLNVKTVPRWREQQSITLRGEVEFPGTYPIRQGETLSSVLERAGGLTAYAFPEGAVFTRDELREREAEELERLANRVESDLAAMALSEPGQSQAISTGQTLVERLRDTEAVGRLVIDLESIAEGDRSADIVLRNGDTLNVPPTTQEVMVLGEVQYSTSHVYSPDRSRDDYISMSGGTTNRADEKRIYIVRASGEVVADTGRRWFNRSGGDEVRPGDTIVVPLDTDRVRPLTAWQGITDVLYNIAIAFSVIDRI